MTTPWSSEQVGDFRGRFPFFAAHPDLVYLDAAATTPMPSPVVDAVHHHLLTRSVNPGRGAYRLAGEVMAQVEGVRAGVAAFLGADADGVAFTSGTTEAFDVLNRGWAVHRLRPGDEILLSPADHAATVGPWYALAEPLGVRIVPYPLTPSGDPDLAGITARVTAQTAVVVVSHVQHVHGERADVRGIRAAVGAEPVLVLDAAQSVSHVRVDVADLGVDAVAFSAHKMFGPPGIGVLWLAPRLREQLQGVRSGGASANARGAALVVERGTLNTAGIAGLGAAVQFLQDVRHEEIHQQVSALTHTLVDELRQTPGLRLLPGVWASSCGRGYGIVPVEVRGVPAADIGFILDQRGICLRADAQCRYGAEPGDEVVRISLHAYTSTDDLDRLVTALRASAVRAGSRRPAGSRSHLGEADQWMASAPN